MSDNDPVIGIDLGTTNTVVATVQGSQPVVIKNRSGQHLTPSVVAVTKAGKRLVGQIAKRQAITNPEETVYAAKRLIGRKFSSDQVQEAIKVLPYKLVAGEHDDVRIEIGGRPVSLPEISAMILKEAKADAEAYFGCPVSKAVITVPAYFSDGQRKATKDAGRLAGLDVLRILNEPTAAAMAYGFGKMLSGKIAVFDLGGGTFDISILEMSQGVFEVIATGGDTYLGGEDFDNRVIEHLAFAFAKEHGVDLRKDRMALQRLKDAAEKAKIELSTLKEAQVSLPFISTPSGGGTALHLQRALSREKLEELTGDLILRAISICGQVLEEAKVKPMDLKEIVLVGGMTRVPKVIEAVKAFFKREPSKGAHPDEAVALGAAVQGNALTNDQATVLLLDVTPRSLGVAVAGGYVRRLLPKNTTVPTSTAQVFNTSRDQQTSVKILVLQGESGLAHENELLGEFVLSGLRQASRGEIDVEVTFDVSSEGILSVSATDKETGQAQSITVTASGGLTQEELKKLLEDQAGRMPQEQDGAVLAEKRRELETLVAQVIEALPKVEQITEGSDFGGEAVKRAREHVARGNKALAVGEVAAVVNASSQLARTLTLLEGVIQRLGSLGQ